MARKTRTGPAEELVLVGGPFDGITLVTVNEFPRVKFLFTADMFKNELSALVVEQMKHIRFIYEFYELKDKRAIYRHRGREKRT